VPVAVSGVTNGVVAVAAGAAHCFFVKDDGSLWGMGYNENGELGVGTNASSHVPVAVSGAGTSGVVAVAGGSTHSLFLKSDGSLRTMGLNSNGQFGNGTGTPSNIPVVIFGTGSAGVAGVAAGAAFSLFLDTPPPTVTIVATTHAAEPSTNGLFTLTRDNNYLDQALTVNLSAGGTATADTDYTPITTATFPANENTTTVSVAVLDDASVEALETVAIALASGTDYTIGSPAMAVVRLVSDDASGLWAMGENNKGQLGDGTQTDRLSPVLITPAGGVTGIAGGLGHSLFCKADGSLWAMGSNLYGQFGNGSTSGSYILTPSQSLSSGVVAVSAANDFSFFLKDDGSLWSTGRNDYGQLGNGTTTNVSNPVQIVSSGVVAFSARYNFSLFVKEDGSLWAMGINNQGQLGNGSTTAQSSPIEILTSGVVAVSAGDIHSLFLKVDGSVWAMGNNSFGQLGDGSNTLSNVPVAVTGAGTSGVVAISAGSSHSLLIKADGSLWAMGYNSNGQLGDGSNDATNLPIEILASGVQAADAGGFHSVFLKTDGSLWTMGTNDNGQLGDGSTTASNVPVQIRDQAV
jgi:alpha-tubulin suppressor-like RCC1 family protein